MSTQQRLHDAADWLVSLHCIVETDDDRRRLVVRHGADLAEQVHDVVEIVDPPAERRSRGPSDPPRETLAMNVVRGTEEANAAGLRTQQAPPSQEDGAAAL